MSVYINGLMLGLSLIIALGPQNVFLIRQGVMRRNAFLSALVCFSCDIILVCASVAGLHRLLTAHPSLQAAMTWGGVLFLLYYGSRALINACQKKEIPKRLNKNKPPTRLQIILLALSFSLLNPHAIIDSLVIIGSGSSQFPGHQQAFVGGVITASLLWFSSLTFTTHYYADLLARATVWRCIELGSGILMVFLSVKLACGA